MSLSFNLTLSLIQDFLEMLPFSWYTNPDRAPLNLATYMPSTSNPSDLGPKTYVAFGAKKVSYIATQSL